MTINNQKYKYKPAKKSPKPFNISFSKIHGISTNFWSVESFLFKNPPDIVVFCETNRNSSIPSSDFSIPGYLPLLRKDSKNRHVWTEGYVRHHLPLAMEFSLESPEYVSPYTVLKCCRSEFKLFTIVITLQVMSPEIDSVSTLTNPNMNHGM